MRYFVAEAAIMSQLTSTCLIPAKFSSAHILSWNPFSMRDLHCKSQKEEQIPLFFSCWVDSRCRRVWLKFYMLLASVACYTGLVKSGCSDTSGKPGDQGEKLKTISICTCLGMNMLIIYSNSEYQSPIQYYKKDHTTELKWVGQIHWASLSCCCHSHHW